MYSNDGFLYVAFSDARNYIDKDIYLSFWKCWDFSKGFGDPAWKQ